MTDNSQDNSQNNSQNSEKEAVTLWYKQLQKAAVEEMMRIGVVSGVTVDAKPAWILPHKILIFKVKETGQKNHFVWVICGEEAITDHLDSSLASSPREVARHFSLKWQLDAERLSKLEVQKAPQSDLGIDRKAFVDRLAEKAEVLYSLVDMEELWKRQVDL